MRYNHDLPVSEVLNAVADLIEERGAGSGRASFHGKAGPNGTGVCVGGAIYYVRCGEFPGRPDNAEYLRVGTDPAAHALLEHVNTINIHWPNVWAWNDLATRADTVVETLRACAVVEAAKEPARRPGILHHLRPALVWS